MAAHREPSMEDILASIKRVIAEEKEVRAAVPPLLPEQAPEEEDVLELGPAMEAAPSPPVDLGPPLMEEGVADTSRQKLEALASVAATAPAPALNPMEELVREMLRPILKQWLDDHLPNIVDEHVKREIQRITGRPF